MQRIVVFLFLVFLVPSAWADTLSDRVVKVYDGDTITLLIDRTQYKIRLAGIDAPERKQAFGNASRKHLRKHLTSMVADASSAWNGIKKIGISATSARSGLTARMRT